MNFFFFNWDKSLKAGLLPPENSSISLWEQKSQLTSLNDLWSAGFINLDRTSITNEADHQDSGAKVSASCAGFIWRFCGQAASLEEGEGRSWVDHCGYRETGSTGLTSLTLSSISHSRHSGWLMMPVLVLIPRSVDKTTTKKKKPRKTKHLAGCRTIFLIEWLEVCKQWFYGCSMEVFYSILKLSITKVTRDLEDGRKKISVNWC